jgi:hypothetical protein
VLAEPFLQVAFLTLPVIPHLKITDKGLVDVDRFEPWCDGSAVQDFLRQQNPFRPRLRTQV